MQGEIEIINVEKDSNVFRLRWRSLKRLLNEQMNAIQRELGQKDDGKSDIQEIEDKLPIRKCQRGKRKD